MKRCKHRSAGTLETLRIIGGQELAEGKRVGEGHVADLPRCHLGVLEMPCVDGALEAAVWCLACDRWMQLGRRQRGSLLRLTERDIAPSRKITLSDCCHKRRDGILTARGR